jgi:molybdopterin converting factor small subunit
LTRLREAAGGPETDEDGRGDTKVVDYLREELADRLSERVEVGA